MKMTIKQTLHSRRDYCGAVEFTLFSCDMSEYGHVCIGEQEIIIDVPDDFNPVVAEIAMLRATQQKIQADAQVKANAIEDQISKLSCIEYKPDATQ